jgi:hypothetical protein
MTVTLSLSKGHVEGTHTLCPYYYALLNKYERGEIFCCHSSRTLSGSGIFLKKEEGFWTSQNDGKRIEAFSDAKC